MRPPLVVVAVTRVKETLEFSPLVASAPSMRMSPPPVAEIVASSLSNNTPNWAECVEAMPRIEIAVPDVFPEVIRLSPLEAATLSAWYPLLPDLPVSEIEPVVDLMITP
jgi:hypothetical protein